MEMWPAALRDLVAEYGLIHRWDRPAPDHDRGSDLHGLFWPAGKCMVIIELMRDRENYASWEIFVPAVGNTVDGVSRWLDMRLTTIHGS